MINEKLKIDPIKFQKDLKQKLESKIKSIKLNEEATDELFIDDEELSNDSKEQSDDESEKETQDVDESSEEQKTVSEIMKAANESGVDVSGYEFGVVHLDFDEKSEAEKFTDFIENYDNIESFEMKSCNEDGEEMEDDSEDCAFYRFWIYLKPEIVSYDYFDHMHDESEDESDEMESEEAEDESDEEEQTEDESEEKSEETESSDNESEEMNSEEDEKKLKESYIQEMERKIKVNYRGKKRVKMQCSPGYKYNHDAKVCEKITGDQLITMRKAVRKSLLTKAQGGLALKKRTVMRTRRADKFRKSYGMD